MTDSPLFPHLSYAQAVHTALLDADMRPHAYQVLITAPTSDAGPASGPELEIHAAWTNTHRFVKARVMPHGFRLVWKHTTGWSVTQMLLRNLEQLPVPCIADPAFIAETACDLGMNGLPIAIDGDAAAQWNDSPRLLHDVRHWHNSQTHNA
ncbi:hypothetical protein [Streptomyces achromogenes]|uniref:hypothetical protein n=1 Tax=Streptomyces achromogenes TaxID=67255 RepID=UPI003A806DD0